MAIRPLSPTAMMTIADEHTNPKGELPVAGVRPAIGVRLDGLPIVYRGVCAARYLSTSAGSWPLPARVQVSERWQRLVWQRPLGQP